MFRFLIKKGLYNLVINEYNRNIDFLKNELIKVYNSDYTDNQLMNQAIYQAIQRYYETVFNSVCDNISKHIVKFKNTLLLNLMSPSSCGFPCDVDNLFPGDIYAFAYWGVTDKKADPAKYKEINLIVYDIQTRTIAEIFK